ncbi:MAG: cupin domain-containing protein, partial [Clostridia bacterium]|nr:cupin domain-containing protein [Clostridia bacterium]
MAAGEASKLMEVAQRIREMREIFGMTESEMAQKTEVSVEEYCRYEAGELDFPFTFIHKCSLAFGIGITDLLEGQSAHLSSYTVTRKGRGQETAKEDGIRIQNLAPLFRKKIAEPYWVRYEYSKELQDKPIHLTKHSGQEFDFVMQGRLKIQIGDNVEYLEAGDSIYYNSSTPHGMIAVDGEDCLFVAVVLPGDNTEEKTVRSTLLPAREPMEEKLVCREFITAVEDENGYP